MTSTFARPTGAPVTASPPGSPAAAPSTAPAGASSAASSEIEPAPVSPPPQGRRRPFALLVAVVGVLALGVVAVVALATGRANDSADVAEAYSLPAAAQGTLTARTVEFDVTVSVSDLASDVAAVTASGAVDNESQLVSATTDLSSLLALGDSALPFGAGDITVLLDGSTGVVYLDAGALGGFLGAEAAWVSIDLGVLAEQNGQSLDDVQGGFALDPTDIARSLLDTDDATEIGVETIEGVDVKHYQVTVDLAAALEAVPQAELDAALADPALADIELPDTVTYDVWVTADNQLRRVAFDTEIAGRSIALQLDMTASDEPLGVELPADSEVVDLTGLLGF